MSKPLISVAISAYDRHAPLFDGSITHPDFEFSFLQAAQNGTLGRHERFLLDGEWEAAELSFSSYVIARDQGLPVGAVPIFPRRLFSQSQLYKNRKAGIEKPADLAGKRVALTRYQNTLAVLAKGDLAHYYNVPWKEIRFVMSGEETVKVPLPQDITIEHAESREQLEQELAEGTIHALFSPSPPRAFLEGHPDVARLFEDAQAEEERHLLKEPGYFPIMHVIAFRQDAAQKYPELPRTLFDIFEQSRKVARQRWNDPNHSLLLWGKHALESEATLYQRDPWANGIEANRKNIQDFTLYSHEQGLIRRQPAPEELFENFA